MVKVDRARKNGLKAAKTVKSVLKEVGWEPEETDEEAVYRVDFGGDDIPVADALAKVRVDLERFIFVLRFRDRAAKKYRAEAMEFVTRANAGLVIGNFELDLDDGSILFKSSIDFTEFELPAVLVRNLIVSAMDVAEHYGDAVVQVVHGKLTAKAAATAADESLDGQGVDEEE